MRMMAAATAKGKETASTNEDPSGVTAGAGERIATNAGQQCQEEEGGGR